MVFFLADHQGWSIRSFVTHSLTHRYPLPREVMWLYSGTGKYDITRLTLQCSVDSNAQHAPSPVHFEVVPQFSPNGLCINICCHLWVLQGFTCLERTRAPYLVLPYLGQWGGLQRIRQCVCAQLSCLHVQTEKEKESEKDESVKTKLLLTLIISGQVVPRSKKQYCEEMGRWPSLPLVSSKFVRHIIMRSFVAILIPISNWHTIVIIEILSMFLSDHHYKTQCNT